MVHNDPKVELFYWQMFAVFRLQYLHKYTIHITLSYMCKFLTPHRSHTYITHISEVYKDPKKTLPNSGTTKDTELSGFVSYAQVTTHIFEVNHEHSM